MKSGSKEKPQPLLSNFAIVLLLTMVMLILSKCLWMLPIQIVSTDFYHNWFTFRSGRLSYWLMITWFYWGSFKVVALLILSDSKSLCLDILSLRTSFLVPFAPLMDFRLMEHVESDD